MDEHYMKRCIALAYNGLGTTYPNPLVGSVVVYKGKVIGEGWHQRAGEPHAEVRAIASVRDKSLLGKSTLYVSLEPCSHFGKTPPCADLIIESGIPKVVIGTVDPFAKVAGRGIEKLRAAGCEVVVGVEEEACRELNKRFFTYHQRRRPYIILKWAETADGFIAPADKECIAPVWITGSLTRQYAHKLRAEEMAIAVGLNTVLKDNPSLTTRDWYGSNPLRIVLGEEAQVPENYALHDDQAETLWVGHITAEQLCKELYERGVQSLIVEGGRQVLQEFIDAGLWDEVLRFIGKPTFGAGVAAPILKEAVLKGVQHFEEDRLLRYKRKE